MLNFRIWLIIVILLFNIRTFNNGVNTDVFFERNYSISKYIIKVI